MYHILYHTFGRGSDSADFDSEQDCEIAYACGMNKAFIPLSDGEQSEYDLDDFLSYRKGSVVADFTRFVYN